MTVCVGAICNEGKAVVVAADRMITYGPPMNLQVEGAVRKIFPLTTSSVLLFSGTVPDGDEILSNTKHKISVATAPADLAAIANAAALSYQELKRKRAEDMILRPYLGLDFTAFQALVAQSASSQVLGQVLGLITQHNLNLDAMIAGVDSTGAHLYVISHPGNRLPMDVVGSSCIGSGGMHAAIRLNLGRHNRDVNLSETMHNVYEAKIAAEAAPHVGKVTDMAILNSKGVVFVKEGLFDVLAEIHKERPGLSSDDISKLNGACEEYEDDQPKA